MEHQFLTLLTCLMQQPEFPGSSHQSKIQEHIFSICVSRKALSMIHSLITKSSISQALLAGQLEVILSLVKTLCGADQLFYEKKIN